MRVIFFCFVVLSLAACSQPLYLVIDKKDFDQKVNEPRKRKLILLEQSYFETEVDLKQLIKSLNQNKFQINLQGNDKIFTSAIGLLLQGNFQGSHNLLNQLDEKDFDYQVGLLKMDCNLEMKRPVDVLNGYQSLLDSVDDRKMKSLIKGRYRFFYYGL